jgi:hypothetical protein
LAQAAKLPKSITISRVEPEITIVAEQPGINIAKIPPGLTIQRSPGPPALRRGGMRPTRTAFNRLPPQHQMKMSQQLANRISTPMSRAVAGFPALRRNIAKHFPVKRPFPGGFGPGGFHPPKMQRLAIQVSLPREH